MALYLATLMIGESGDAINLPPCGGDGRQVRGGWAGTRPDPFKTHDPFAISRSRNFWILPVEVFGISANTTAFGTLKRASSERQ